MEEKQPRLELSLIQVVGGAAAAMSSAVAASYLGVAGTLIGAAVASVVATVATAVYSHSLHATRARLLRAAAMASAWRAGGGRQVRAAERERESVDWDATATLVLNREDLDGDADTTFIVDRDQATAGASRSAWTLDSLRSAVGSVRWRAVALATGLVFVLAMGAVTAAELVVTGGRPLAAAVTGDTSTGTTLGGVAERKQPAKPAPAEETPTETPTPEPSPSPSDTPTPTPTTEDTPEPTPEQATPAPDGGASESPQANEPTDAPSPTDAGGAAPTASDPSPTADAPEGSPSP